MGGHGACANPNLDVQKQRVQFWLRHPHSCQCCVLWDVGLALAPSWAPVEQFPGYFVVCIGLCRPRVGTILGVAGAVLGYVGTFCFMSWQFWAILGAVSSMQGVSKKHRKCQQKIHFLIFLLMVFAPFFCYFCFFFWGMLHLGHACLISGLCWTILGYVSAMLGSCLTISVYFVVVLASVWARGGTILALSWVTLSHVGTL